MIRAARQRWPDAQIDVIGFPGTLGILKGNADVRGLLASDPKQGWRGALQLLRSIWNQYELVLITQPSDRAHLIGWAATRHYRSGLLPRHHPSNWWKKRLLDHVIESDGDDSGIHVVQEKLALLEPWYVGKSAEHHVQPPSETALPSALAQALRPEAIVVHAPSMWRYKQWPVAHFRELIGALTAMGHQVVLTGSASANDQACVQQLLDAGPATQILDTSGQLDWNQLTTLFKRVALYIGPDTSVTHLAAACGVKVITLFGPTNPARWGPWALAPNSGQETTSGYQKRKALQRVFNVTLVQSTLPCVPCTKAGCENHNQSRSDCLPDIKPQQVMQLVQQLLPAPSSHD
ncbi:glycosyltransferase family 9 protein [Variovorax sp. HJSM1_2]|uniref:glycosyltransferase family 9 protein n=1 Tax=Variovorax sp. HJSM1_2 TaxID=3366263 RepID=UPI003BE879AE